MNVGYNIRKARLLAGLSQEELAHQAGINRTYLSQLENGRSSPTLEVLEKIARALELSPAALLAEPQSAREPEPRYEVDPDAPIYQGLLEFLNDERTRLLMKPTPEEIEVLKGIRFLNRFSPSRDLFVEVLLDYRRRQQEREEVNRPDSGQAR